MYVLPRQIAILKYYHIHLVTNNFFSFSFGHIGNFVNHGNTIIKFALKVINLKLIFILK